MCERWHRSFYDQKRCLVRDLSCGEHRIYLELLVRRVDCRSCGKVKREKLGWLADNPFYTKRFRISYGPSGYLLPSSSGAAPCSLAFLV